jgi:hypothetical protein
MSAPTFAPDRQHFRQVLAEMAEKAKAKLPESNGRVDSGVKIVLADDIDYNHDAGSAVINSCSDPQRVYHVKGTVCDCRDFEHAPRHYCKHRLALALLIRVHEVLKAEAPPEGLKPATDSLPEAASSVNVRVLVQGHECQITLRDHDEGALLQRLQAVLARKDVQPLPSKPAPRAAGQQWKRRQYQGA